MEDISNVFIDPENPEIDYAELDFDEQLKHTQRIKGRVLHKLISDTSGLPTDKDGVELILKVADSMDKTTIAKKRLAVDAKSNDDASSILNAIVQLVQSTGGKHPSLIENGANPVANQDLGELPSFEGTHAEGEAEIGVIVETSDNFTRRMDVINRENMQRRAEEMGITGDDIPTETPA